MNCTPTIGIDFKLRTIELDSKKIKLQVNSTGIYYKRICMFRQTCMCVCRVCRNLI